MVVYGLGGVGLNCLRAAVLRHANPVIAVDLEGSKEEFAMTAVDCTGMCLLASMAMTTPEGGAALLNAMHAKLGT